MEDRLKKFVAIVDAGSFTAAAELLHTSQPALSTAIQKLERELKAPLLERGTHQLTPAGKLAYKSGKQLQIHGKNLRNELAALSEQKTTIRIGMIDSIAEILFLRGNELELIGNESHMSLIIDSSTQLVTALDRGEIDVALIVGQEDYPYGLSDQKDLGSEPLVLVTSSSNATDTKQAISEGRLPRFLSYRASTTQKLIQRTAILQGIDIETIFYTSPNIMLGLVLAGKGSAVLPYYIAQPYIQSGKLQIIELGAQSVIKRKIALVANKQMVLPQPLITMTDRAKELLRNISNEAHEDILKSITW